MQEVRWGAIGCGDVCERKSGPPLYQVPGSRLLAVHRRDEAKGRDFAERHGCRFVADAEQLLADPEIDAVYIATQPDSHEHYTLAAARAGKHVLVEKEMATDAAACQRMVETCREAGVVLAVAFYRRCYPSMLRTRQLIDAGAIGAVRELHVNDQFPLSHRLDLAHFLCGDAESIRVADEVLPPGSHAGRGPVLRIRHRGGAEAVMNIGWDETHDIETVLVVGEQGRIRVDDLKAGIMTLTRADGETVPEDQAPLPWTHWGLVANVVAHLQGQAELACDGIEGRKSQVIEDIVQRAAPDGEPVTVRYG